MYKFKLIENLNGFKEIKNDWEKFEKQISDLSIFSTYNFLYNFWLSFQNFSHAKFGVERKLKIILIYNKNELHAILPLCIITKKRKKVFRVKYLELLGQQFFTSTLDIISKNWRLEGNEPTSNWIKKNIKYDILNFELVSEKSKLLHFTDKSRNYFYNISPEIILEESIDYLSYKKGLMSSNFRGILNNSINKIKKENITYETIWKNFEITDLETIEFISASKLKDGKYNIYSFKEMSKFALKIYELFNAKIGYIILNNKIVSYQVYIFYNNQCMWFDISYDREFAKYRPGILQYNLALENLLKTEITHNILGFGFDQNKMGIINAHQKLFNVIKPGNGLLSRYWYNEKIKGAKKAQKIALEKMKNDDTK